MKKATLFFVQGGGEGAYIADKHLVSFLRNGLGTRYKIIYPKMPKESDPDYDIFETKIKQEVEKLEGDFMLAGHSLGACFLLKYLSENKMDKNIVGLFLASTPYWGEGGWQFEGFSVNYKLVAKVTEGVPLFFYHSTTDETVPFSHLSLYKKIFPQAGFREIIRPGHQMENDLSEMVNDIISLSDSPE